MGGATSEEGRVEFCHDDEWGTVCDDSWGTSDASVVCRQLGFSTAGATAFSNAAFGRGSGPILLDDVNCVGTESRLANCPADAIGDHNCVHNEDAGVRCMPGMLQASFWRCFTYITHNRAADFPYFVLILQKLWAVQLVWPIIIYGPYIF